MTREEAIKLLTQYIDYDAETPDYYEMEKACKVALKVLKQEPCEDCISRAEAIANIRILYPDMPVVDIMGARHKWSEKYQQYRDCEKILADLPSIQPKPKTGHWIKSSNGMFAECSDCGKHGEYGLLKQYKYCPNCGAKMESEDKE